MGAQFKCVEETTMNGRIVRPGETVTVRDSMVQALDGHPCWEKQGGEDGAPAEKPKAPRKAKGAESGLPEIG